MNRLLTWLVKAVLWLRYRVRIRGLDDVVRRGRSGILFLPNHPALIDPVILASHLYGPLRVRALADRRQIDRFFIRWLARRIGVLPIEDVATIGPNAGEQVHRTVEQVVQGLRNGDNFILYPAGRAYHGYLEDLGGTSAVETILNELPEVRVVLVRTRGLWGSAFSRAPGTEPDVATLLRRGIKGLLLNGIFFGPRRHVEITLAEPDDLPRSADRRTINRYLETFYNVGAEHNTYVPYTWRERGGVRTLPEPQPPGVKGDPEQVPEPTRRQVADYLRTLTGREEPLSDDLRLAHDLGMDSLARADLVLWLGREFGYPPGDVDSLRTVGDVMLAACGQAAGAAPKPLKAVPDRWFNAPSEPVLLDGLEGMTVCEAFLAQARRRPAAAILVDQTSGVKTYRDLVMGILALKPAIEALDGTHVGIMLPSSVAANVVYLATLFAGKTPVMVNWTTGRKNVLHGLDALDVSAVLTARELVSRLGAQGTDLGDASERFVYLEDVRASLTRKAKLAAWVGARLGLHRLGDVTPPETAVILFTSGSENVPKIVPLTHRNMLTNIADAWTRFTIGPTDSLLGILPPFHSFGVTATMLLSTCVGLRAAFYPNPTEGAALAAMIDAYCCSILVTTPTFLNGLLRASDSEQLLSLRLVVSGAEACPPRVYEAMARQCPQAVVLEGYGVTECSPIISVNSEDDPRPGTIGPVLPSLDYAIRDPDTLERVDTGERGMLLVRGPSVFGGYLHYEGPSPFVETEGHTWYRTGDLVRADDDGCLTFAGRIKRFAKIGGEMISLPAIEAVLTERFIRDSDEGPILAVVADKEDQRPDLVLFAVRDIDREEANAAIRAAGLSALHNIRRVEVLDDLPLLGTGKTDYRALKRRLVAERKDA
ncbi:MAG: AMP-binding protein [Planctomycetota bacterium]